MTEQSTYPEPPDRDTEWSDPWEVADGVAITENESPIRSCGVRYLGANIAGYVVDGADVLISEHAGAEIDVPSAYKDFGEFETRIPWFSLAGSGVGFGVDERRLEDVVRVATGGGRFRTGDLTVRFAHEGRKIVAQYDGHTWLFASTGIRREPEGFEPTETFDVDGIEVPERNATVRAGMARFFDLLSEWHDREVTALDGWSGSRYHFATADGGQVQISGSHLKRLGSIAASPDEVRDSYTIETEYDEEYDVIWEEVAHDVGDELRQGRVAGYRLRWEDPRTSSRVSMTGKIVARATYYYLYQRKSTDDYDLFEVRDTSEKLAEFEPENEDWSPFST